MESPGTQWLLPAQTKPNTGSLWKWGALPGRCGEMYPSDRILKEIQIKGGRVIITSDCHKKELLDYGFDVAIEKLKSIGFKSVCAINKSNFIEQNL